MNMQLHLFDPLQEGWQPVFVDLTVAVQEGQHFGSCSVRPPHSGPDETLSRQIKRQFNLIPVHAKPSKY